MTSFRICITSASNRSNGIITDEMVPRTEDDVPSFIHQWEMSSLNQSSQQLAPTLEGEAQQFQSSQPFFNSVGSPSSVAFRSPSMDTQLGSARAVQKTINWGSCSTELNLAPNMLPSTMLQFQSLVSSNDHISVEGEAIMITHASERNAIELNEGRLTVNMESRPTQAQDHYVAERKRRERLSQLFIELSAILPGLKKMDKATILGDAVSYVKDLEEKVKCLQSQNSKMNVESVFIVNKSRVIADYDCSSSDDNFDRGATSKPLPEVEVKILDRAVLIRILCENHKGVISKVLAEIENLHLIITSASIHTFAGSSLHFTIAAKDGEGFSLTSKEVAKKLNSGFNHFMKEY